jgi:glucose/arabinose dehydrogenase
MTSTLRRLFSSISVSLLLAAFARAQHPQLDNSAGEKPWPNVGFVEVFDGTKIPTLGRTNGESGDVITDMRGAGDGSGRIFLAERLGKILILKDGKLLPDPFLDITPQRTNSERGMLSIAFPPDYKSKGHFYVYRTDYANGDVVIERYKVDPQNPDHALADSAEEILRVTHRTQSNHNGGQLQFGPKDGFLYFGIGDGGAGYDPPLNGQNIGVLLGKMLRIDVESKPDEGKAYHVPTDNPFLHTPGARPEIWAFGVRNPWRWSFDPVNGDMYIGHVGQDHWEQIYYAPGGDKGGENYGWSIIEGTHAIPFAKNTDQPRGPNPKITYPVAEFSHDIPPLFTSITGGYVYRGKEFPDWQGVYFFSDWGNGHGTVLGQIWAMRRDADGNWETHQVDGNVSPLKKCHSFGIDDDGNLYAMSFADGKIYKLVDLNAKK